MYLLKMSNIRRQLLLITATACLLLASCGGSSDESVVSSAAGDGETAASQANDGDGDEDHDDDHGDDEDHDDEDHDDDHGDEDHDDEDHDDDDHDDDEDHDGDDHGDEDHDDDHGDEDHDDEDHDDEDHHDDHDDHGDESSGGLDAHVHGSAELFVAWTEGSVVVDLISPANNIFGFEREPSTDEEQAIAADRTDALVSPGVLAFNDEADCTLVDDVSTDLAVEGSHAELTVSWSFECANPDEINELDATTLFTEFPAMLDVDAQWVSDTEQSAAELTPSSTILRFE